jgi:hypothetical protein
MLRLSGLKHALLVCCTCFIALVAAGRAAHGALLTEADTIVDSGAMGKAISSANACYHADWFSLVRTPYKITDTHVNDFGLAGSTYSPSNFFSASGVVAVLAVGVECISSGLVAWCRSGRFLKPPSPYRDGIFHPPC